MNTLVTTLNSWTESASAYTHLLTEFGRVNKEIILMSFDITTYSSPETVEVLHQKVILYHELRRKLGGN